MLEEEEASSSEDDDKEGEDAEGASQRKAMTESRRGPGKDTVIQRVSPPPPLLTRGKIHPISQEQKGGNLC